MQRMLALGLALGMMTACGQNDVPDNEQPEQATPAVAQSVSPETIKALRDYESRAQAFVEALESDAGSADLSPQAQVLMDLGVAVVPDYVAAFPACGEYLQAASKIAGKWSEMTPEAIEADYHDDGALPSKPEDVDCYHMKDLVVHPATALSLLAQDEVDFVQVRLEIYEVIAHAQSVRLTLEKYVK